MSTKYLSLRDIVKLRLVCKKLSGKISQQFVIDILKEKYSKYFEYGNNLLINLNDIFGDTINSARFIKFGKGPSFDHSVYTITDNLKKLECTHRNCKLRLYPFTKCTLQFTTNSNNSTIIDHYLDTEQNKIISMDTQIRKFANVSRVKQMANLVVDVVNPLSNKYSIKKQYGKYKVEILAHVVRIVILYLCLYLFASFIY